MTASLIERVRGAYDWGEIHALTDVMGDDLAIDLLNMPLPISSPRYRMLCYRFAQVLAERPKEEERYRPKNVAERVAYQIGYSFSPLVRLYKDVRAHEMERG